MALKPNAPVYFEAPTGHGGTVTTFGYVWGKSASDLVPVRLALAAAKDPILCYPSSWLRVMPYNAAVVDTFLELCQRDNLEALCASVGRPITFEGLAAVVETVKEACAYRTEKSPAGGRSLDAAASALLSGLCGGTGDCRRPSRKRSSGRTSPKPKRPRAAGTLPPLVLSGDDEQAEPPEEQSPQQQEQERQQQRRPRRQQQPKPKPADSTAAATAETTAAAAETAEPQAATREGEQEVELPIVCRQISIRTLTLVQCLSSLRHGGASSTLPDIYVRVRSSATAISAVPSGGSHGPTPSPIGHPSE